MTIIRGLDLRVLWRINFANWNFKILFMKLDVRQPCEHITLSVIVYLLIYSICYHVFNWTRTEMCSESDPERSWIVFITGYFHWCFFVLLYKMNLCYEYNQTHWSGSQLKKPTAELVGCQSMVFGCICSAVSFFRSPLISWLSDQSVWMYS